MNHKTITACCLGIATLLSAGLTAQEKKQPLVGKWKNDPEQTKQLLIEKGAADIDEVLENVADVLLNFKDDGTFIMSMGPQEVSGKWKTEALDSDGRFALTLLPTDGPEMKGELTIRKNGSIAIQPEDESPAVFVLASAGENKMVTPTTELLAGMWTGDREATKKANKAEVDDALLQGVAGMKLELRKDETYSLTMDNSGSEVTVDGTWKLGAKSEDGKTFDFKASNPDGDLEFKIWMLGKDQLVFQQGDNPPTAFLRKKKDDKK